MRIKKIVFTLLFIATFSLSYSQNIIFNYGRSFSTISATDMYDGHDILNYKRINSPYYGVSYTQGIWKLISVEIGMNYTEKGFRHSEVKTRNTKYFAKRIQLNYFSVPVLVKVYNRSKSGEFYPFASFGVYKSFLTGGDYEVEVYNTRIEDRYIDNDWGLILEAGISYYNFEFNIGYSQGIKNIAKKDFIESVVKNNTIYTSIGYNIGLRKKRHLTIE